MWSEALHLELLAHGCFLFNWPNLDEIQIFILSHQSLSVFAMVLLGLPRLRLWALKNLASREETETGKEMRKAHAARGPWLQSCWGFWLRTWTRCHRSSQLSPLRHDTITCLLVEFSKQVILGAFFEAFRWFCLSLFGTHCRPTTQKRYKFNWKKQQTLFSSRLGHKRFVNPFSAFRFTQWCFSGNMLPTWLH